MGLTPLEGLMMGTRSGDVDGGAVTFIMDKEGLAPSEMSNLLNKNPAWPVSREFLRTCVR